MTVTIATYAATTVALRSPQTRARLTTRSMPQSRWPSTTTRIAAGKNACDARCVSGVNRELMSAPKELIAATGTNETDNRTAPTVSQPSPRRRSVGSVVHRR